MRKLAFLATVFAFFVLPNLASAQQGDAMLGFGTLVSPGAGACGSTVQFHLSGKGRLVHKSGRRRDLSPTDGLRL